MSEYPESEAPWGQDSFDNDRNWHGRLPGYGSYSKNEYQKLRQRALEDPEFDLFEHFMPTGRPKLDIGRYVMRHALHVPIIHDMQQWQAALRSGHAMLRSELPQDYSGLSGLLSSKRIHLTEEYPRDEEGNQDYGINGQFVNGEWVYQRNIEGPVYARPDILRGVHRRLGSAALTTEYEFMLISGLSDGTLDPAEMMRQLHWHGEWENLMQDINRLKCNLPEQATPRQAEVSRWQYIPGINIRIFRDPVIEGKYFIGGEDAHHHWEVTEGRDSPNVVALDKGGYRGRITPHSIEYELPTHKLVDLYEKVRTLPYFDQTQTPLMELQYGFDDRLYFLQYLKTGHRINDPGVFKLSPSPNGVTSDDVRGATSPDGERIRIYIDPPVFKEPMHDQGIFMSFDSGRSGDIGAQIASVSMQVVILDSMLSFKDNHYSSAPLYRPPVAIGVWDTLGEVEPAFKVLRDKVPRRDNWFPDDRIYFIEALVTSNGRKATIESDWQLHSD